MKNKFDGMDGMFEYDGKDIYYRITDNYNERPRIVKGIEKIGRYLNFYDDNLNPLGVRRIYGTYDEMNNIHSQYAKREYEEMRSKP